VKRLVTLVVALAFALGSAGFAAAQSSAPVEKKAAEAKTEKKAKKMPAKNANGTVKSATADSLVVAGKEKVKGSKEMRDVEWTFAVGAKTAIKKGGKAVTAADLMPGDAVHVRYTEDEGKATATAITVKAGGKARAKNPCAARNPCAAKK